MSWQFWIIYWELGTVYVDRVGTSNAENPRGRFLSVAQQQLDLFDPLQVDDETEIGYHYEDVANSDSVWCVPQGHRPPGV